MADGPFHLPPLPFEPTDLVGSISAETLDFHYNKHHKAYVNNLNGLVKLPANEEYAKKTLEEIIRTAPAGGVFNNAAQIWNHTFYWHSLARSSDLPEHPGIGGGEPTGHLLELIKASFKEGGFEQFKAQFTEKATKHFASGWVWLVYNVEDKKVEILETHDADSAIKYPKYVPLLTCDVWEHAYYIDYRNVRAEYVQKWWRIVNWKFAEHNLANVHQSAL